MARLLCAWFIACALLFCAVPLLAAVPSEKLLPSTTAGYVSVPNVDELRKQWDATQLGQMFDDPIMKPFVEDLHKQLKAKLGKAGVKLGITLEDLDGVYGGEVALAAVQPALDAAEKAKGVKPTEVHALVVLVDVTGKEKEVAALLKKIDGSQKAKGGKVGIRKIDGVEVTDITLAKDVKGVSDHAYYAVHDNQLVMTDHLGVITGILGQMKKPAAGTLAEVEAYKHSMEKLAAAAGELKPHVRWYVDPFRYVEVARAMSGRKRARGSDIVKILKEQGFDAAKGAAGHLNLMTADHELLHRTVIFAPDDPKALKGQKYRLGMRMLEFPNKPTHPVPAWVPHNTAAFASLNWNMKDAFDKYLGSIVDAIAGDEIFEEVLESIQTDPHGPKVDLRKDLFAHLGERAMIITDAVEPIDIKSERLMVAIELTKPAAVAATLDKAMEKDPDAKKRLHKGQIIWEITNEKEVAFTAEDIKIEGAGGDAGDPGEVAAPADEVEEEEERVLPNSAITVAHGHLIIASHVDHIVRLLDEQETTLDNTEDFIRVNKALDGLGGGMEAARHFVRTDKAYQTTYELVRNGTLPKGETVLARILNRLLTEDAGEDEVVVREALVDGKKMPEYAAVRKYFGPAGFYMTTDKDGWSITGCLLKK